MTKEELGGIYGGFFTPTESAAVAVVYALIVGKFVYKELTLKKLMAALSSSAVTTSTIMVIVGTATVMARMLTLLNIPTTLANTIANITGSRIVLLLIMNVFLLFVGMVMDSTPAILILAPILLPIAKAYGIDAINFGLMMVLNISIGFLTPPVGLNLFVACSLGDIEFPVLCRKLVPFIFAMILSLLLVTYIPAISTILPQIFMGYTPA